jgi:hypothetical protein
MCYFLAITGNAFKTCHDAADDKAGGKIKERRRSGVVNMLAHEVHGPINQVNRGADGALGDGADQLSNRAHREALQALAFQLGWDIYRNGTPDSGIHAKQGDRSGCRILH